MNLDKNHAQNSNHFPSVLQDWMVKHTHKYKMYGVIIYEISHIFSHMISSSRIRRISSSRIAHIWLVVVTYD